MIVVGSLDPRSWKTCTMKCVLVTMFVATKHSLPAQLASQIVAYEGGADGGQMLPYLRVLRYAKQRTNR